MPERSAPPRRRRGRVIFIGADDLAAMARGHLHQPPAVTDDLFEAMALIAQSSARDLIAVAVLGDEAVPDGEAERIARALRRIDPSVELIRSAANGELNLEAAQQDGFDQVVRGGSSIDAIFGALGEAYMARPAGYCEKDDDDAQAAFQRIQEQIGHERPSDETPTLAEPSPSAKVEAWDEAESSSPLAVDAEREPAPLPEPASSADADATPGRSADDEAPANNSPAPDLTPLEALTPERGVSPPPAPAAKDGPSEPPTPEAAPPPPARRTAGVPQTPKRPSAPPPSTGEHLGDIDLVRMMLDDPEGGFRETILSLARQQTGWTDLALLEMPPEPTDERAACRIAANEPALWLVTGRAAHRQLRPWANWMTDWLALADDLRRHRAMAYTDDLTGAYNRRAFELFMTETIDRARERRRPVTVMVFDIDNFKQFNDEFGHAAGDEILCEIVRLISSVIRTTDRIFRIGGDEFVVVFSDNEGPRELGSEHPSSVERIARRFQKQVHSACFPSLGSESAAGLTISGGLATFPWDGATAVELLGVADRRALASKGMGKNHIMFGPAG
jgi:diguanylate cyclase (GGDEF)-like protein